MERLATIMDRTIKAIPTYYSGTRFRSKLEASFAKAFDALKMRWVYEPEGYNIDGTFYLPDFYFPIIKTFFEVKGPLVPGLEKAAALYHHLNRHREEGLWWDPDYAVVWGDEFGIIHNFIDRDSVCIALCGMCGERWFMPWGGSYACRACQGYDGDHHISETVDKLHLEQIPVGIRRLS